MEHFDTTCPNCKARIHIPFLRELKEEAIEEADLAERTARERLAELEMRLRQVSLLGLLKFWIKRGRN